MEGQIALRRQADISDLCALLENRGGLVSWGPWEGTGLQGAKLEAPGPHYTRGTALGFSGNGDLVVNLRNCFVWAFLSPYEMRTRMSLPI